MSERCKHNLPIKAKCYICGLENKLNQAVEALEWIVECGTDYQSMNKARNALCEIKGGESDE